MAKKRHSPVQHLLYGLVWMFFTLTRALPLRFARHLGAALAALAYVVVPRVRKTGLANLDLVYGDTLSTRDKKRILFESVRNLGLVAAEFSYLPTLLAEGFESHVTVRGIENIDRSQGCIFIGAHLGNWEWMLPVSRMLGLETAAIVREFDDPRMDGLVSGVRQSSGVFLITKDNAMGTALRVVRENGQVGLLADQNPRQNAVPVTFFGRETWGTIGPALLAMRGKVPIHPISMIRNDTGGYVFTFYPPVELRYTGSMMEDLRENTQRCQDALEAIIREYPGQWLWLHRRWKRRERLESEWKKREEKQAARYGSETAGKSESVAAEGKEQP
ncbi:MAG: lysophospholipid acyltransferase family protein [Candidatus Hydrogenedentes bacterium]|nr:lysophospholipid acyltransferase family protein [Candidatus Hydrogenedentota bacterium]